jgi:alkaline phosphatase D
VLWARLEGGGRLRWEVAESTDFEALTDSGSIESSAATDFTAKVDVDGLKPGTTYWYRFQAPDGEWSPRGRTKTLPAGGAQHLKFAVVSCAKFNAGFFNGYARIAERDDLDFVLHLGRIRRLAPTSAGRSSRATSA